MMSTSRRIFLRNGGLAVIGTAAIPAFLTRAACAAESLGASNKRLIVIFLRGGADGLNIVVPHQENSYYGMRPSINVPRNAVIDLDGFFGLHPSLAPLHSLWKQKHLAIVHAVGSPHPTRSHFAAQDFMESGTPGLRATEDGWLNRALPALRSHSHALSTLEQSPIRAIALGPPLPRILSGGGRETDNVVKMLTSAEPTKYTPAAGVNYPTGHFGDSLKRIAQLIKTNLGVQVAFADMGGWDHHVNEGSTQGQLASALHEFSQALAALWTDLGNVAEDTVIVTMSEFGRSVRENGKRGTDHGHANVMFVLGGPVKGGEVYGLWPGLDQSQLYEGRDLAVTTDFRQVLGEGVQKHLGNHRLDQVFPGFASTPVKFLKYLS